MAKQTRELILDAFINLAQRYPQRSSFTMTELAAEAGISRQAIYQKHFNNFEDIIDYIHKETDQQIFKSMNDYSPNRDGDPLQFLADHILPLIYARRNEIRTLYTTQADPGWKDFLKMTYSKWVLKNIQYKPMVNISKEDITHIITSMAISFIEVWIHKENPIPPEEFKDIFLQLTKTSLCDCIVS